MLKPFAMDTKLASIKFTQGNDPNWCDLWGTDDVSYRAAGNLWGRAPMQPDQRLRW